jgi:hypothetical protein
MSNFTVGREGNNIQVIVLHDSESQELPKQADIVARVLHNNPGASAHAAVDNSHAVTIVADTNTAWHCDNYPINLRSLGLEIVGVASQTPAQWIDPYSTAALKQASLWCKPKMVKNGIPAVFLTDIQLVEISLGNKSIKGFTTHADVSRAFKIYGGHTDPGVNFPRATFLALFK